LLTNVTMRAKAYTGSAPLLLVLSLSLASASWSDDLDSSLKVVSDTNQQAIESQQRIDGLALQTQKLLEEYQLILSKTEYQDSYNVQLEQLNQDQQAEIALLHEQLNDINITQMKIMPLMHSMADALEKFVVLDLPFHQQQRITSVIQLKQNLRSPALSLPDKYRMLLEAFQIETGYGKSIESYRDTVTQGGDSLSVEFLRIGRSALYYRTLDGEVTRYWNANDKEWALLSDSYNREINQAMRVASEQVAPQLFSLPMVNTK
jgi:Protein of unknown function (DUF3450)